MKTPAVWVVAAIFLCVAVWGFMIYPNYAIENAFDEMYYAHDAVSSSITDADYSKVSMKHIKTKIVTEVEEDRVSSI